MADRVKKVTDAAKQVTDTVLLAHLSKHGIDKVGVEFVQDYGKSVKGVSSPYAKFYRDLNSNKRFAVISQLPMCDADGVKLEVGWDKAGSKYVSRNNLFHAVADEDGLEITIRNDQPDGRKENDKVTVRPQIYLDGAEINCIMGPVLLGVDPVNENYHENVLEWDFGICKRRIRVIEGRLLGSWIFSSNPRGQVRIKYNQTGEFKLKLGQFRVNDDEELIPAAAFDVPTEEYPLSISDTATFYPDAHPETSSVDGRVYTTLDNTAWNTLQGGGGSFGADTSTVDYVGFISGSVSDWNSISRSIILFYITGISGTITGATLSLKASTKVDDNAAAPTLNIYSASPASNTEIVAGDYDSLGSVPFCDTPITYAGWSAGYKAFVLNEDGLAAIAIGQVAKFGVRTANYDVPNTEPPRGGNSKFTLMRFYDSEKGADYKPKLVVTYTPPPPPPDAPTSLTVTKGTHTDKNALAWTKPAGTITGNKVYRKLGAGAYSLLDTVGDVEAYDDTSADPPLISPGAAAASDGTHRDKVALALTGDSVANGTEYTYKVVAYNGGGDGPGSNEDTGYRGHGTLTHHWEKSAADSDASYSDIVGATSTTYDDVAAPVNGRGRYYRCVLDSIGAVQATSTVDRGYRKAACVVVLAGVEVVIVQRSLRIRKLLEQRKTATFTIIDKTGTIVPTQGNVVEIYGDGETLFSGIVDIPQKISLYPGGVGFLHTCKCIDWHYLADKIVAAKAYADTAAGTIAADLVTTYLAGEGVSVGEIQTGPTLKQVVANYVKLADVFDTIAEKTGFIWDIDELKRYYFIDRATNAAPWAAEYPYIKSVPEPSLTGGNPLYRNRQYVKGAQSLTALQTETRTGDGATRTFTLGFPLALEPVITVGGVAQDVGIKGVETGKDWYWSKGDSTVYAETAPALAAAIVVEYYGQYRIIALSYNKAEITRRQALEGGTGYVDDVIDSPNDTSKEAAFETGAGKLLKYCRDAQKFVYATERKGLKPGQLQPVNHILTGSQSMLIDSVDIEADGDVITYTVTAVTGPEAEDWTKFFARLADASRGSIDQVNLGSEETLIVLVQTDDTWGWEESVTNTVFTCSVPETTLYPSATLYPC